MSFVDRVAFAPLLPIWAIAGLGALLLLAAAVYAWRRGRAPLMRSLGLALILLGIAQPMAVRETREPAADVALVLIDQSESLAASGRLEAARAAGEAVAAQIRAFGDVETRLREVRGGPDGTALFGDIEEALADAPRERIAGTVIVSDGQISDAPDRPERLRPLGPVHGVIIGDPARGDRRIELLAAPAFGLIDEPFDVEAIVHDQSANGGAIRVRASIDGKPIAETYAPPNTAFRLRLSTSKRGPNLVMLEAEAGPEEISSANNRAAFTLSGVRDRLRVLLVTGEPYPGARVWRNLLKADPAVDLVHFTILRPPEKLDSTPIEELALIQFPTYELFVEKLDQFDLIIFDRYRQRGALPLAYAYFENVARRVEAGGALLVVAGPQDAAEQSIFGTPLAAILPSSPTRALIETPYRPAKTRVGERHPVTRGLPDPERWGRWERLIGARATSGETLLTGAGGQPLLVLGQAGQGRVAQLWSDQAWLWARGYDGGGPHAELLRRLAHWLMREPELEPERLRLDAERGGLAIERVTLDPGGPGPVALIGPDGARREVRLTETQPGVWRAEADIDQQGVWEARSGALTAFAAIGPTNLRETTALAATDAALAPVARATGGVVIQAGERGERVPEVRRVGRLDRAGGADWIGLRRRDAYSVRATAAEPLGPGWAWALAGFALFIWGWRREAG